MILWLFLSKNKCILTKHLFLPEIPRHGLDYLKDAIALFLSQEKHSILRIMGYVKVWASCAWIWFCEGCLYKCLANKGERNIVLGMRMYQKKANCGCGSKQKLASGTKSTNWVYHLCLVIWVKKTVVPCDLSYIVYVLSITYSSGSSPVEGKGSGTTEYCPSSSPCTPTLVFVVVEPMTEMKSIPKLGCLVQCICFS